jgi:hypothetical protein
VLATKALVCVAVIVMVIRPVALVITIPLDGLESDNCVVAELTVSLICMAAV